MKILHIASKSVYPKVDGGCVAIDNFMRLLVAGFGAIDHLCISTPKHPFNEEIYQKELPKNVRFVGYFFIDTSIRPILFLASLTKRNASYQVNRFYSHSIANFLKQNVSNYDVVVLESAFLTPYLSILKGKTKVYFRTHNVESNIWKKKGQGEKNLLKRLVFQRLAHQLSWVEKDSFSQVSGLIHISNDDFHFFQTELPTVRQTTIPVSISEKEVVPPETIHSPIRFGFLGAANWHPNQDAVQTLLHEVFPSIQKIFPNGKLYIAGRGFEKLKIVQQNVENMGTLDSLSDFYQKMDVILAPLSFGSGLKIKSIEAILYGKLLIGSSLAFEGLDFLTHQQLAHSTADYSFLLQKAMANPCETKENVRQQQSEIIHTFGEEALISKIIRFVTD